MDMEKEACVLQKNMKAWVMRRNYQSMRDSVRKLQLIWREKKNSVEEGMEEEGGGADGEGEGTSSIMAAQDSLSRASSRETGVIGGEGRGGGASGSGDGMVVDAGEAARLEMEDVARKKLQAAFRGHTARKNFKRIKQQTLALIVIQRALLARRQQSNRSGVRRNRSGSDVGVGTLRGSPRTSPAHHGSPAHAGLSPSHGSPGHAVLPAPHGPPGHHMRHAQIAPPAAGQKST
mmetsp:Transcript_92532/g.264363  ORF Transcript_92532/g.264363 Transcript_92532/m.264363 type:complete len:233 (+) Transcript_92532:84-782(+)